MALSVITETPEYNLSRNPIPFVLQTDNHLSQEGVLAKYIVLFGVGGSVHFPELDDQIKINVLGNDYTFKFINDASTPGINEIKRNNTGTYTNFTTWIQEQVIPVIKKNYDFGKYFDIYASSPASNYISYLFIVAKNVGVKYTMVPELINFTTGVAPNYIVQDTLINGLDNIYRDNFKLFADIYIETAALSGEYFLTQSLDADVKLDGKATFYLDRVLHKYLSNKALTNTYADVEDQMQRRFYVIYGEKYGTPIKYYQANLEPLDKAIVQLGGISEGQYAIDQLDQFNLNFNIPYANLLTYFPANSLPYDAPLWISYLCQPDIGYSNLNLKIRKYTPNDGWQMNIYDPFNATVNYIFTFDCSSSNLEFLTNVPGNEIQKIEICISHEGLDDVAGPYTIYCDYNQYASANVFVFRNSLGRFDSIYCTGSVEEKPILDFDTNILNQYSDSRTHIKKTSPKTLSRIFETSTGPFAENWNIDTATYRELLLDFFTSDLVYIWKDARLQLVNILTDKPDLGLTSDTVSNIPFKYEYAHNQVSFSPGI